MHQKLNKIQQTMNSLEKNLSLMKKKDNNHTHEHSLMCSCTKENQTPNNKETNDKMLPADI